MTKTAFLLFLQTTFSIFAIQFIFVDEMKLSARILLVTLLTSVSSLICAQFENPNFVTDLAEPDSITGAMVLTHQDARLLRILTTQRTTTSVTTGKGYRVQLFSSNVPQKGKEMAFRVEKNVLAKFPDFAIYVNYKAPFWKVRVGDCVTYDDANTLRTFMIREFPEYQSDIYIVPDQINIPQ